MKIFEVTGTITEDEQQPSQNDRMKAIQNMARAGLDTSNAAQKVGKGKFSNTDTADMATGKKYTDREIKKSLDKRDTTQGSDREQERQIKKAEQQKKQQAKYRQDKENHDLERKKKADTGVDDRYNQKKDVAKAIDKEGDWKVGADGRILKDPRFYGKDGKARPKPLGAISTAIANLRHGVDPVDAVADYYNDKVNKTKSYFGQRF